MELFLIAAIFVAIVCYMIYNTFFNNDIDVEDDDYSTGNINDGLTGEKPKDQGGAKQ